MGDVKVSLSGGALGGTIQTNDGVGGLVMTGGIDGGGYVLGTPLLLTSPDDLATNGITTDGNAFAVRQVQDFYTSGGEGAQVYLMLVPNTVTVDMMADEDYEDGAKKLLDYADGAIKVLGLLSDDSQMTPITTAAGLNELVHTAAVNMKVMANSYFLDQKPFRCIIGGTGYTGVPADLTNYASTGDNTRVAILIGDTVEGDEDLETTGACIGLVLGLLAVLPVQRKISRVKNGSLPGVTNAYVGMKTVKEAGAGNLKVIAERGYITFRKYVNKIGFFFYSDPTLVKSSDDYSMIARGRVIDKAHALAYATFIEEVDEEVFVIQGKLDAGYCKWLSQQIINQINNTMTANGEISEVACTIDPNQNILSTNKLAIRLKITPVGYATEIEVGLGFNNPAAA